MVRCAGEFGDIKKSYRVLELQRMKCSLLQGAAKKASLYYSDQLKYDNMYSTKVYLPRINTFMNVVLHTDIYTFSKYLFLFAFINFLYYFFILSRYFQGSIFSSFVSPSKHISVTLCFTLFILFLICVFYPIPSYCFVYEFIEKLSASASDHYTYCSSKFYLFNSDVHVYNPDVYTRK